MLKYQKTLEDKKDYILNIVKDHQKQCRDEPFQIKDLFYDPLIQNFVKWNHCGTGEEISVSPHAETQLLSRLKMPAGYIHKCPAKLRADNINYWISRFGGKPILLRWKDNKVRAIFSTRFSADLDDHILIPVALEALYLACADGNPEFLHLKDFIQDPDITMLRAVFKNIRTQHDNNVYFAGVSIVNSEIGKSSIWIKPMIRGGDEHGAYDFIDRNKDGSTTIRHIGQLGTDKIKDAILKAQQTAEVGVYQLLKAAQEIIKDPVAEVKDLVDNCDFLTERLVDIVDQEYKHKQEVTRLKLAHSMLVSIRGLPIFKRYLAEQEIGRYLDLFSHTKERLESITKDINTTEAIEGI